MIVRSNIAVSKQYVLLPHNMQIRNVLFFCLSLREMKGSFLFRGADEGGKKLIRLTATTTLGEGRGGL